MGRNKYKFNKQTPPQKQKNRTCRNLKINYRKQNKYRDGRLKPTTVIIMLNINDLNSL